MVVGLGNPGPRYAHSRHNVGFMAAEQFLSRHRRGQDREERGALVGAARWAGESLLVVRPLSFMNLSGGPVRALSRAKGVDPSEIVLLYDDSDLPLGSIRVRPSGRAAGHRGVASVMEALGTEEICRVRMGIGRPEGDRDDLADHVLGRFESGEEDILREMISRAVQATEVLLKQGVKSAMNLYNRRLREPENP